MSLHLCHVPRSNLTIAKLKVRLVRKWTTVFPCSSPCLPLASPCLSLSLPSCPGGPRPVFPLRPGVPPHQRRACLNQDRGTQHRAHTHTHKHTHSHAHNLKLTTAHPSMQSQIKHTLTHCKGRPTVTLPYV